ncbi:MAG: efflux transporter outer membrane subunit [Phenylobacterium sp.]|uniref:efflux transporter outer membrane subunit n=1 Tax=Phenylobacterium sp. TaxID=1871053 RepID=UPI00273367D7|nr:efflux transporter outer membrane subunit [Phenylobacterium sp.]MDP3173221.1 efflux transporter outer membrane subunit [Phenylobacterium sp.]
MTLLRILAASAAGLALSACAVGPDYQRPQLEAAAQGGFVSAGGGAFTPAEPQGGWWRLFANPALDGLVAEALSANKDIAVAAANLGQVRAQLSESRAGRLPSTTLSGQAARVRQLDPASGRYAEGGAFAAGFDASYELDFFGRVGRSIEAARADEGAAQAAVDVTRIAVAAETARAFADACAANAQIAVARRTLDLQQQTFDLTRRQQDAGRGAGLDVARAGALLETTRATLPPLEAQRDGALFRLAVLVARPPAQVSPEARDCLIVPQVATAIPTGDGSGLLRRRPDVRQAERALAAATARIGVATASLYPSVTLGGSIGTSAARAGDLGDDFSFSVGPLISWNFPNIAVARARVRQAGAVADGALARFEQTNLTALQETETALTNYARELDRRAALQRAAAQSARASQLSRLRFDAGADSFLAVLDAERTRADLDAQLARSDAQVTTNQIAVFKVLGGGW